MQQELWRGLFTGLAVELLVISVSLLFRDNKRNIAIILALGTLLTGAVSFNAEIAKLIDEIAKVVPVIAPSLPTRLDNFIRLVLAGVVVWLTLIFLDFLLRRNSYYFNPSKKPVQGVFLSGVILLGTWFVVAALIAIFL